MQRDSSAQSAFSAGSSGDFNAAQVAINEAIRPDINTASSKTPSEIFGNLPPRSKNTGAIASSAQTVPVIKPQNSKSAFSATTM